MLWHIEIRESTVWQSSSSDNVFIALRARHLCLLVMVVSLRCTPYNGSPGYVLIGHCLSAPCPRRQSQPPPPHSDNTVHTLFSIALADTSFLSFNRPLAGVLLAQNLQWQCSSTETRTSWDRLRIAWSFSDTWSAIHSKLTWRLLLRRARDVCGTSQVQKLMSSFLHSKCLKIWIWYFRSRAFRSPINNKWSKACADKLPSLVENQ